MSSLLTREREPAGRTIDVAASAADQPLPILTVLLVCAWFALIAGMLETAILAFQQHVQNRIIYRSLHYLWMPPAGAFLLFALVALLLRTLALRWRAAGTWRSISFVLVTLAVLSVITVPRGIHFAAAAVLSLGTAVAISRWTSGSPVKAFRIVRRTLPVLLVIMVALVIGATVLPAAQEKQALGRLAAGTTRPPNVLFIILDTVRAKSLGLYGYFRETTPNLDTFARRGVVFDRAIAPSPWTLPTHASLFTGLPSHLLSADRFAPLDAREPTLAEILQQRGYATAGFVANLAYASYEFGLQRGFLHWHDYPITLTQVLANSSLTRAVLLEGYSGGRNSWLMRVLGIERWIGHTRRAPDINANLLRWLSRNQERPFFAFVNYFDAHMPYLPPPPHLGTFGEPAGSTFGSRLRSERPGKWPKRGDTNSEVALLDRYEESIAYLDSEIGDLLSALEARGLLANTLVVISSDHGEEFGEHGHFEHDSDVFFTQVHVPLIMVQAERIESGLRVQTPVALEDIGATILELTGSRAAASFPGRSLVNTWTGAPERAGAPILSTLDKRRHSQASLVTPIHHYIRFGDGHEEIYDHTIDVDERNDLARSSAGASTMLELRSHLGARLSDKLRAQLRLPTSGNEAASAVRGR